MRIKKPKKPFLSGYKTYNPRKEGYGNADDWRGAFFERLGFDKAVEVLGEDDPMVLFGLREDASWEDVCRTYRRLARENHPDLGGSVTMMKKINAAFEVLERRYGIS
jgi:DnaJ-domain-containing protein 1